MAKLNKYNEKTKKVIHLIVTPLCDRDCKYCCNKQYDMNDIPYVTDEELKDAEILCLTGGEPFKYSYPSNIAHYYKKKYPNIKKVYVYTNALELYNDGNMYTLKYIDGVNVSIKKEADRKAFNKMVNYEKLNLLNNNRVYIFDNLIPDKFLNFTPIYREWQQEFEPADDSIFRRV